MNKYWSSNIILSPFSSQTYFLFTNAYVNQSIDCYSNQDGFWPQSHLPIFQSLLSCACRCPSILLRSFFTCSLQLSSGRPSGLLSAGTSSKDARKRCIFACVSLKAWNSWTQYNTCIKFCCLLTYEREMWPLPKTNIWNSLCTLIGRQPTKTVLVHLYQ